MEEKNGTDQHVHLMAGQVKKALDALDSEWVEVDGTRLKPSQCYHFEMNPPHVLFNTNCPDNLKRKIQAILSTYTGRNEDRSQQ